MADWVTISSLATAGGTLVLAVATFSSVRSANRAARVAEKSLLLGTRPILTPSREEDPVQRVRFGDGTFLTVPGHGAAVQEHDGRIHMAIAVRNGGAGLGVILGWRARSSRSGPSNPDEAARVTDEPAPSLEDFRRQQLDLYIPAGETGVWFGGLYDRDEPGYRDVLDLMRSGGDLIWVDLLYGNYERGQLTIARFGLSERPDDEAQAIGQRAFVLRYWDVDDRTWS